MAIEERTEERVDTKHEPEAGEAASWFGPLTEVRYTRLAPKEWHAKLPQVIELKKGAAPSLLSPGPGPAAMADMAPDYWLKIRQAHGQRRALRNEAVLRSLKNRAAPGAAIPSAPGIPGTNNWIPIGPAVVRKGQATSNPPISGRVTKIAVAPGGSLVYAATADGGVWRSDDGGASWKSTMEAFDLDPTSFAATSCACGAIAIDPLDPARVYVGTGEADTFAFFASRVVTALPTYHGIGPVRSDTGGSTWVNEPTAAGSPTLAGCGFFELAVDPGDRENVVAATTVGLYRRESDGAGGYQWVQKRAGIHTSVVVCRSGGVTTFSAAAQGAGVFTSADGSTWTGVGTGFPATGGRVSLGVRPTDPSVLYAFVASGNSFFGLYRLDGGTGPWRVVSGLPAMGGQASYNLPIAVDPNNANLVYLAGQVFGGDGSIYRCTITSAGSGGTLTYSMTTTFIGTGVHADVHALIHAPGDSSTLWTGTDGGLFRTTTATGTGSFTHRNTGLSTLCCNFFAQHPTQLGVMLVGLQDNGTARYTGEEAWKHVFDGDGGYPLINWNDPNKVLAYANGAVRRATDGGQATASFTTIFAPTWMVMAEPLVGTPINAAAPAEADIVAFGAGTSLFFSSDFGTTWGAAIALPQNIFALVFASATRLYLGTTLGQVYRFDKVGAAWNQTRIDNAAGGALPLAGIITDIQVDPADATGASIYVAMGGSGDFRHVWHFDGTQWVARSGSGASALLDVEHNCIIADPANTATLYVGSDVGVWQSTDSGNTWSPMENGLPDAAVFDLQIHPATRILRASTHGRGMFEFKLAAPAQADVELYARDTALDVGRASTVDGLSDPETWPVQPVLHYLSRNIKVDVPTPAGYQTPTNAIDFLQFNDVIVDGSQGTATIDPATGTVVNRVYVEIHNRGIVEAASVQVMLLLANASAGLPLLPAGYTANVLAGTPITSPNWQTVGVKTLTNVRAGFPLVAEFNLPSTMLPPPSSLPGQSHHCLLAIIHSSQDGFTSTAVNADNLTIADRKVAQRNLELIAFVGTPPPPAPWTWSRIDLFADGDNLRELVIDARTFTGVLGILLPPNLKSARIAGLVESREPVVDEWIKRHTAQLQILMKSGRYSYRGCAQMVQDLRAMAGRTVLIGDGGKKTYVVSGLSLHPGERYPVFLALQPDPAGGSDLGAVNIVQRDVKSHQVRGGSTYKLFRVKGVD
ncbi:MAG: hypothetical protein AABM40_04660 [Chloroflexota bacterium]